MDPHLVLLQSNAHSFAFCQALAAIGRVNAALVTAAAATESASAPEEKNRLLALLARLLGSHRPAAEAATNRAVFGCARAPEPPLPRVSPTDPLALFAAAGEYFHPLSYAAAAIADRRRAREVAPAMATTDPFKLIYLLTETIATGGPNTEVTRAFAPGAATWLRRARPALSPSAPRRATLSYIRWTAGEACAYYLLRRAPECWASASAALEALEAYLAPNKNAVVQGVLDYEAVTVAILGAHCVDINTAFDQLEALVAALVRPRDTQFTSPLRGAFYFTACGHAYRHLARQRGGQVTIVSAGTAAGSTDANNPLEATYSGPTEAASATPDMGETDGVVYNRETLMEAARKYIVAAATLPLDDPELPHRYDRVLWCLILAGGVNHASLWPFLVARARAEVDLYTAPVAECELDPGWPCFENGPEVLSRLFDSCMEFPHRSDLLLPTFVVVQRSVYASDGFFPTVSKFVRSEGYAISPALRPQIRHLAHQFSEESAAMVALWTEVYCESHGAVPDDIADAIGQKYWQAVEAI